MSLPMKKIPGVPDTDDVRPGMAFFAGTGPFGTKCGDCCHRGYKRLSSKESFDPTTNEWVRRSYRVTKYAMFKSMTGKHGADIDKDYPSCKYYEPRGNYRVGEEQVR
jgi:hypothetical protein